MTPEQLIPHFEAMKREHVANNRKLEVVACDYYISIFEKCLGKYKKNKHEAYIMQEFYLTDRMRLQFRDDDQCDDAFMMALKQEAYRQFWVASGLPPGTLVKRKFLPFNPPPIYSLGMYSRAAMTGRTKS